MVVGAGTGVLQDMEQEGAREELGSESWDEKLSCAWSCPRSDSKGCHVAIFFRIVQKKGRRKRMGKKPSIIHSMDYKLLKLQGQSWYNIVIQKLKIFL